MPPTLADVLPTTLILRTILVAGGAFKATYEFWDEGLKERYFFVANRDPANDDLIILFTATTQEAKRKKHHGSRSSLVLVTVEPTEYEDLTKRSVIDCEFPVKRPRATFEKQALAREYKPLGVLPKAVVSRVQAAVSQARTLSTAEKRLILPPDEPDPSSVVPGAPKGPEQA